MTIQVFENALFGEVRTIDEAGKTLFCGSDVARALGYKKPYNAVKKHCPYALNRGIGVVTGKRADGTPAVQTVNMAFIPESDVYRLIARSNLPEAEKFERWIFDEVIPTIRAHGGYLTPDKIAEALADPDTIIQLATTLKIEREKRKKLEAVNEQQRQALADFTPLKQYLDKILESPGTLTTSQIAADYEISANKLNKILAEERVQRNVNGQWILYKEHMGRGYTKSRTVSFTHSDGTPDTKMVTHWTQKGRLMIHSILQKRGIVPAMDKTE